MSPHSPQLGLDLPGRSFPGSGSPLHTPIHTLAHLYPSAKATVPLQTHPPPQGDWGRLRVGWGVCREIGPLREPSKQEEQPQECPDHGCNSQVYDQNETPLGILPWYSVQPVQPYIPILLISTCIIQERINYAV